MKGPDNIAVYACFNCHDLLDGRRSGVEVNGWDVIRALAETQCRMIDNGLININGSS